MRIVLKLLLVAALIIFVVFFDKYSKAFAAELTAFTNATIIDGTGGIKKGTLLIRDDKIIAVKPQNKNMLKHVKVIDATDKYIMPTLITTHSHLGITKGASATDANNTPDNVMRQLRQYAKYGVGVVTSLGRDEEFIYGLRDKYNKSNEAIPYILTAGQGIGVEEGAPPAMHDGFDPVFRPQTVADAKKAVQVLVKRHPDIVKIWVDSWWGKMPKMQPDVYKAVIDEAHKNNLRVASHIYNLADAKSLVADGVDILEHSVRDMPVDAELINAMKSKGTAIVPTLFLDEAYFIYADHPAWMSSSFFLNALEPGVLQMLNTTYKPKQNERGILALAKQNIKKLHDAGIKIGFGTDSGAIPERVQGFAEHQELRLLVESGFTPMQAIQTATRDSAQLMHINKTHGTLIPGKKASFMILNANPLEDIRNTEKISSVWLNGKQVN